MDAIRRIWLGLALLAGSVTPGVAQLNCDDCEFTFTSAIEPVDWSCENGSGITALPPFPSFSSTCSSGNYFAKSFRYPTFASTSCEGVGPDLEGATLPGLVLTSFTATGLVTSNQFFFTEEGLTWVEYSADRARLTGQLSNGANPSAILDLDLYFDQSYTGLEFLSDGGELDVSSAQGTTGEDWGVWILKPFMSKLVGSGDLEGYHFLLDSTTLASGTPLQVGSSGANAINQNDGLSGDFDWYGCVGETVYAGNCALAADFTSCETASSECGSDFDYRGEYFVGNLTSFDQTFATVNVVDNTPPTWITLPADYSIDCNVDLDSLDATESIVASDGCSGLTIDTLDVFLAGGCPNSYTRQRTFVATDACGLSIEHTQTVNVSDNEAPTLYVPDDYTIGCQEEPTYDDAWAEDNCSSEVEIEVTESIVSGSCPAEYVIQRTFTARDECGNETVATQSISVSDLSPPTLIMPNDTVLPCGSLFITPAVTAFDDCSAEEDISIISFSNFPPTECDAQKILRRRFIAVDECGNASQGIHFVYIDDVEGPEFTFVPEDMTVACGDLVELEMPAAIDACGSPFEIAVATDTLALDCGGNFDLVRTFTATDDCGNSSVASQTISVRDNEAPILLEPLEDVVLDCQDTFLPENPVLFDNCSETGFESELSLVGDPSTGNYQLIRTVTAFDLCGNTSEFVQTVTFVDSTAPQFESVPEDYVAECTDDLTFENAIAVDDCGSVTIETTVETVEGSAVGNYNIVRTFVATDDSGNSTTATQTITVQDTTAPEFTSVPADYTAECSDDMTLELATATDLCGPVTIAIDSEVVPGNATGNYTVLRSFVATDDAGNSTTAVQTITVEDTTAPAITFVPEDVVIECSDDLPTEMAMGSDLCGTVTITFEDSVVEGNATGNYTVVRTFSATDDAGNSSSATQTITVQDTTAPEFTFVPADYTVECSDEMPMDDATAADNCGEVTIEVSSETTAGDAAGNYVIVRTFTATDDAGNSSSATQTITVQDTTAPELTFVPADYTVECSDEMPMDDATASDNCGEVTIEVSSETTAGDAAGNYVIVRTFTATDDAGNSSSATQTVTVQDTTAPEFTFVPADYTVECSDEMPMEDATASDNCGEVTIEVSSETIAGDAAGNYVIVRTFTATDDAGNSSSATQTISVQDTTAPEFTFVPADYTVECSDEMPMDDATASDNCGEVTIEVSSETTAGDAAGNYVIVRMFTATDDAGNSASATQTITVQDTTAPEFTFVPTDYTVECSDEMPMDDATASDNCGEVTIEVTSETIADDAAGNYVIVRTFTATDDAGNSSSATQTITVQDTTAPEFTFVPADYTVECSDEMPMDNATATDNCGEVTIEVFSETTAGDAAGNYVIVRTFTATDDAGNSASATQTITVQDTTAPEFTFVPADYTVECSDEMPMDDATASDNCGEVTIEVSSETTAGDAAGNYVIVRTFTATDDAGNSSSATQTITVQDTTTPEFTFVPADYTVECSDEMPMDDATASDNCGEVTIEVSSETIAGDAAGNYVIVRTFTATDDAGNSSSATQTITVQDTTAPEFTFVPADYTVECSDEMPMDDAVASDNCGEVTIEVSSETTAGDAAGNYVIIRTFTATDDAGNSASATQTITVQDTTAPEFTFVPADYTVECSDEMPMDDATASDNCGEVTIEVTSETTAGDAAGNYVIIRTFTATDDAGNSSSATQTITVQDTTAPEFTFEPADYTVECSDEMPMDDATATDNCGEVTIEVSSETTAGDAAGNYVIVRTFTATDDAGNSSSATQTITVQDTTAPEFSFVPADYTVECSDEMPMDNAEATDNCGSVSITVTTDSLAGSCPNAFTLLRTFVAEDDAGNASQATQAIEVVDTTPPTIELDEAIVLSCNQELGDIPAPETLDNCGPVTLDFIDAFVEGSCVGPNAEVVRTWEATDACGLTTTAEQLISFVDTIAPNWVFFPSDSTMECSDPYEVVLPGAIDNCTAVSVTWTSDTLGAWDTGMATVVFLYVAEDACGNAIEGEQSVTFVDTTPPVWTFVPNDQTINCADEPEDSMATAEDGCSAEVEVEVTQTWVPGPCEGTGQYVRVFVATDASGNQTTAQQTINVVDTEAPTFEFVPADLVLECDVVEATPVELAIASDLCSEANVTFFDENIPGENAGNYTIERTFVATDDCGNANSVVQTIVVVDTTAPVWLTLPEDRTIECGDDMSPQEVDAFDACTEWSLEVLDGPMDSLACDGGSFERTFVLSDLTGNLVSETVTITLVDTTPPSWTSFPEDTVASCLDALPVVEPSATDACSAVNNTDVSITMSTDTVPGSSLGNYTVITTFVATDACGNQTSGEWTVTVVDDLAPSMVLPADTILSCDGDLSPMAPALADGCGVTSWVSSDSIVPGDCPGWYTILRTYTAQDDADNDTTAVQTIQVVDTLAPVFTYVPEAVILECSEPLVLDSAMAEDNCSGLSLTSTLDTLLSLGGNQFTLQVTWTATDLCDNTSTAVQDILILDQEPPTLLETPDDAVVTDGDPLPLDEWTDQFVYVDNCQDNEDLQLDFAIDTLDADVPCVVFVEVTWTLSDLANNETQYTQFVQLTDNNAPVWVEVSDSESLACGETWELVDPVLEDQNEFEWSVAVDTIPGDCPAEDLLLVTYSAMDVCGNLSNPQVREVQFFDTLAPVLLSVPSDLMLEASADVPACDPALSDWEDNCSEIEVECITDTLSFECPGTFVLERTFVATDACGNVSSATQLISVEDLQAPEWVSAPEDVLLSCDSVLDALLPDELTVTDNESSLEAIDVILANTFEEGDNCAWTLTSVYEATDGCGNMASTTYTIAWVDSTPPSLEAPLDDLLLVCLSEIPSCEEALVEGVDDCNDWNWYCDDAFVGGGCEGPDCTLIRTVHLLDACDNESVVEQTIVISEPPTVPELPGGISPNGDQINDLYMIANVGPNMGFPPCDWLTNTRLMVFDRWGSVVFQSTDVTTPWDGTNLNGQPLPVGTYFVVFETQGATYKKTVDLRR